MRPCENKNMIFLSIFVFLNLLNIIIDDNLTSLSVHRPEIRDISLSFSGALGWSGLRDTVSFPLCLVDPDVDKHIFETSMSSRIGINYTPTALVPLHFRNWKASPASESADGNIMLFSGPRSLDGTVCDDRIPAFRLAALRSFATHDSNTKPKSEDLQTPRSTYVAFSFCLFFPNKTKRVWFKVLRTVWSLLLWK